MSYNTKAIRDLLQLVFNDEGLTIFCYDYFRSVNKMFAVEMSFLWKIHLLIDYCERYDLFDELLIQIKKIKPKQYDKYISLIKGRGGKGELEVIFRGDLLDFTPEIQFSVLGALTGVLDIPRSQIRILEIRSGSILLRIEMPIEAVKQLISLYESNNPVIKDLGILQVNAIPGQSSETTIPTSNSIHEESQMIISSYPPKNYETIISLYDHIFAQRERVSNS